ncbi:MAG: putative RDD family membrane protein YckC [Phenylobacterium sp.]|jgi:uncharacterized RDD family membrane protein YckC
MANPYETPEAEIASEDSEQTFEYVGFWSRCGASLIDTVLMMLVIFPVLFLMYGGEYFDNEALKSASGSLVMNYLFPIVVVLAFWMYKSATPGKMVIHAVIVDAKTGEKPSKGQLIGRYLGYYLSLIVFGLWLMRNAWAQNAVVLLHSAFPHILVGEKARPPYVWIGVLIPFGKLANSYSSLAKICLTSARFIVEPGVSAGTRFRYCL